MGNSRDRRKELRAKGKESKESADSAMVAPPRRVKRVIPPVVKRLCGGGAASELFGWAGLMFTDWFALASICICFGFAILALGAWFEPEFSKRIRVVISIFFAVLLGLFLIMVVFASAPLEVTTNSSIGNYPTGTIIGGREWKPYYSELRIRFSNPTNEDYDNFHAAVGTDLAIVDVWQVSTFAGVSIFPENGLAEMRTSTKDAQGHITDQIGSPLGSIGHPYHIQCDRLPRHGVLEIVIAVANMGVPPVPHGPTLPDDFYGPKRKPEFFGFEVTYKAGLKPYSVGERRSLGSN